MVERLNGIQEVTCSTHAISTTAGNALLVAMEREHLRVPFSIAPIWRVPLFNSDSVSTKYVALRSASLTSTAWKTTHAISTKSK